MKKVLTKITLVKKTPKVKKSEIVENINDHNIIQTKKTMEELYLEREVERLKKDKELKIQQEENGAKKLHKEKTNMKAIQQKRELKIVKKSHQKKIHDINTDISMLIRNEKIPGIFEILKEPDLRALKKALANIKPGDEIFEKNILDYKSIELLKIFTIMNSDKIDEKYNILRKYKISKYDQRVAIAIRMLDNISKKLGCSESLIYYKVFSKSKARLKYPKFFKCVLNHWQDVRELLDDREYLRDSSISHSKEIIKFTTCDTLLNINDVIRVALMKYLTIDFKESRHTSLKYSTIKLIEMVKKYSLRYLNTFSNLDWDLSGARYKIIRNFLSKEKTNKFNLVLRDELLKINNDDYNNLLLGKLQDALNSGLTILDIIKKDK